MIDPRPADRRLEQLPQLPQRKLGIFQPKLRRFPKLFRQNLKPNRIADFFDLPSYCISSKMSGMPPVSCIGERFNAFLAEIR